MREMTEDEKQYCEQLTRDLHEESVDELKQRILYDQCSEAHDMSEWDGSKGVILGHEIRRIQTMLSSEEIERAREQVRDGYEKAKAERERRGNHRGLHPRIKELREKGKEI